MNQQRKIPYSDKYNKNKLTTIFRNNINKYWVWFLFFEIICLCFALIYIIYAPKIYTRTATVLFQEPTIDNKLFQFSDEQPHIKKNIDNEICILKSKQLMLKVARQLKLDVNYVINTGLHKTLLYENSPLTASFPDGSGTERISIIATPVSEKILHLSGFPHNKKDKIIVNFTVGDTVSTPIGRLVIAPTIHYNNKYYNIPITIIKDNIEEVAFCYSKKLKIGKQHNSASIIKISLNDISITRNEDIINELIKTFREETITNRNEIIASIIDFIYRQLFVLEEVLNNSEANQVANIEEEENTYINKRSHNFHQEISKLNNQKMLISSISNYILNPERNMDLIPPYTLLDNNINTQITEYNNLIIRKNDFALTGDDNQTIEELNNAILAIKENIIRAIGNRLLYIENEINKLRKDTLYTPLTTKRQTLSIHNSDVNKAQESLFFYFLKKREELLMYQSLIENEIEVIEFATGSGKPVSPNKMMIFLNAIIIGIILPTISLIVLSIRIYTIRDRNYIESHFSIPLLGEIPYHVKINSVDIVITENSREPISEAFRIVRSNLILMNNINKESQVIMLTSFDPETGKTFASVNLAISLALSKKKIILIDLDMRKSTLSLQLSQKRAGISDFLSGKNNNINEIVNRKTLNKTIDIVPSGPVPLKNPSELLLSKRLDILINDLKKHYDFIILDTPPLNLVADATVINRITDISVFLFRAGKTNMSQLYKLEQLFKNNTFHKINLVLNRTDIKQFNKKYREYYDHNSSR